MNKLKTGNRQPSNQSQQQQSRRKYWISFFWVIGIISFVYVIRCFSNTLIGYTLPLFCSAIFGLIAAALLVKKMKDFWYYFIFSAAIFIAVPLFINDVFASSRNEIFKERITAKYHSRGARVEFDFRDLSRMISAEDDSEADTSSFVILTTNKGLLGYYIIRDKKLVKD